MDSGLLDDLDQLHHGPLLPLAGTRHVLIEFPRSGLGPTPEGVVHELVVAGWRPLLAHPELLPWLASDLPRLAHLVDLGARLQLTGMSFTGGFGGRARQAAEDLVDAGLAHVVASDAHGIERRPPGLQAAFQRLAERWDEELARALTFDNPAAVLADQPLPAEVHAAEAH